MEETFKTIGFIVIVFVIVSIPFGLFFWGAGLAEGRDNDFVNQCLQREEGKIGFCQGKVVCTWRSATKSSINPDNFTLPSGEEKAPAGC